MTKISSNQRAKNATRSLRARPLNQQSLGKKKNYKNSGKLKDKHRTRSEYEGEIQEQHPFLEYETASFPWTWLSIPEFLPTAAAQEHKTVWSIPKALVKVRNKTYHIDWLLPAEFSATGNDVLIESKGLLTQDDASKIIAFASEYPDIDYRLMFYRGSAKAFGWKGRTAKTNLEWAASVGIPAIHGNRIPDEWLSPKGIKASQTL